MTDITKIDKNLQNPTKNKAIQLLSAGVTKTEVANQLGISRDTIYDWLKDDAFRIAVNLAVDNNTKHLSNELAKLDNKAIDAIERALNHENVAIALKAALGFIEVRKSLNQIDNIYTRIEQLEMAIHHRY